MTSITEYIEPILRGEDMSFERSTQLLDIVFEGDVPEVQIAGFLTALRAKGETAGELAGLARSLRKHAVAVEAGIDNLIDTCGTGGAAVKTFNISTAAALVAAGAGVYVAKHGNRGITSSCGSADVLAELGVKIEAGPETVAECIRQARIGFMFAPMFHPAMKYVQPVRKALGFRTAFNMLGPLANPAGAAAQVMGVADEKLMETMAQALGFLGTRRAMVVHSDGLDEISLAGVTKIVELKDGELVSKELKPADVGMKTAGEDKMRPDEGETSAEIILGVLKGEQTGARRDVVVLNAAAAIITAGAAEDFESGIKTAAEAIDGGAALAALEKLIEVSNA